MLKKGLGLMVVVLMGIVAVVASFAATATGTINLYLPITSRSFVVPDGNLALLTEGFSDLTILYAEPDGTLYDLQMATDMMPEFSPNGQYVQFDAPGNDPIETDVMVVSHPNTVIPILDNDGTWLPDSSGLGYTPNGGGYAYIDLNTLKSTLVTSDRTQNGQWIADASQFIYSTSPEVGDGMRDIYRINRDGTGKSPVYTGATDDHLWKVLPDNRIIFAAIEPGTENSDLYVINLDGSNLVRLTNNPFFERSIYTSHDGTQLLFLGDNEIVLMDTQANLIAQFPLNCFQSQCYVLQAEWLPDTSEVFFTTYVDPQVGGPYNTIYRVLTDGSETTPRLVRESAQALDISDDGRYLGYHADIVNEGTQRVTVLTDLATGTETVIYGEQGMQFRGWRPGVQD